jgi:hypothetical protein
MVAARDLPIPPVTGVVWCAHAPTNRRSSAGLATEIDRATRTWANYCDTMPGELRFHGITHDDRRSDRSGTGELLDRRFSHYGGHFVAFLGIVAVPHLCVLASQCLALAFQSRGIPMSGVSRMFVCFGSGSFEHSWVCSLSRTPECGGDSGTHDQ